MYNWTTIKIIAAPVKGSPNILICSDNHLLEVTSRRCPLRVPVDHIIHLDLPDDFETFSNRYTVFTRSHSILRVNLDGTYSNWVSMFFNFSEFSHFKTIGSTVVDPQKPPANTSSSTIFFVLEAGYEKPPTLLLSLLARGNILRVTPSLRGQLQVGNFSKFTVPIWFSSFGLSII